MTPDIIVKKILASREFWCDLGGGKRIKLRRPAEAEVMDMLKRADGKIVGIAIGLSEIKRFAVDWEGFTEADLIPSGASDVVAFAPDLFAVVIEDRADWVAKASTALVEKIVAHEGAAEATRGN